MRFLVYGLSNGWGGVEAIVMTMVSKLYVKHNFDILLSNGECTYENNNPTDKVRFLHIPAWGNNRIGFAKELKALFRNTNYDYVWINGCLMSNKTIISITKKYSNAKIITHSHGSSFEEGNKIKRFVLLALHYLNRKYYLYNVDVPCMCSYRSGLWYYGGKYMLHHNVHLINNGIEISRFVFDEEVRGSYRKKIGLEDEIGLFHAGRLTEVKNQKYLIEIVSRLKESDRKYKLFIAGEGELEEDLKHFAHHLGVDKQVVFMGKRDDVDKLYQAMDVFLLPSFHEGFPVTLTEAQVSGLLCLVSNNVSNETNLTNNVKYLEIGDAGIDKWVSAIEVFDTHNVDRREMANIVSYRGFDVETVCQSFEQRLNYQ